MGKSSKKRKGRVAQLADSSSAESSRQATPVTSDSEESITEVTPPSKKPKVEKNGPVRKGPKTSQDICEQHGLVDVDLEYTEADYKNLTNYGLFVRMVRPQVQEANPSITSSKMAALMEAKWREFREGNPFSKTKKAEDILSARNLLEKPIEKKKESPREEKKKEKETPPPKPKAPVIEWGDDDDDDDDEDDDDDDKDEDEEEEEEEEEEQPRRRSGGSRGKVPALKIRLPGIKMPTPSSSKKTTPKSSAKKSRSKQNSDVDSDMDDRSRRSSGRAQRSTSKRKYKEVSEEDMTNDDEEGTPRSRRQTKKKKRQSSEDEDFDDDEDDFQSKKKKKPISQPESESDPGTMTDSESIDSDDDGDRRSKKKKKPETKAKPLIPGERKSERSRKGHTVNVSEMTDREFEKMLKEKEKEKKEGKKKKEKKKKKKSQTRDIRKLARKGYWQKENEERKENGGEEGEDDDNHNWFCEVCEDGGELLLCDKCPRSFHKECAKLEIVPEGDWECPKCTGDMSESEDSDTGHEHYCRVCRDGGDVLLCDHCPCVYHMTCLNPPMKECPDGEWKCPRCVVQEKPLKGWVQNILTWRWSNQDQDYDELDHTHSPTKKKTEQMKKELAAQKDEDGKAEEKSPERLLFVKYRDYSYWECDWITELQLEVFHSTSWTFFKRKYDQEEPPALEDGSSFGQRRHHTDKADDPYKLEERFYKWGIKPSWLQIHRIINHDTKGKNKIYLVKWQDLGYEYATWEDPREAPDGLEDFDKHIDAYWKRRNERLKAEKEKSTNDKTKKSLLKKKCEAQPSYFDETGGKLHPYQLEGLNWLRFSYSQDTNTILADEMGLGKTIQAISFLYVLWKEGYTKGPFLVSAPLSTVPNWEREFQFWAPEMYVLSYSGGKDARHIIRENEFSYREGAFSSSVPGRFSRSHTPKFDVLLTSYEMVSMDKTTFASIEWDVIIIDEAHRLRSNQSLFFKTLVDYKVNYKLLLTGTPLQNNLEELFHLLNFLEPGKFDDIDNFLDNFSEISKDDQVRKLHEMLAPHMLRRMKVDVLKDIPPKSEFIVRVELAPMQKKFYKHILTKNYEALNVKGYGKQTSLINIMMDLRKCCNHPYLFPSAEKDAPLSKNGQYEINALTKNCGKLDLLSKMLKVLKEEGHRVLIFSQMTRVLDILEDFLYGLGYGYERIDGSIMGKLRQAAIDRFNSTDSDSFVFLLSTKAGGLGINLATADTVIIFDMDWNPHNDIQAFSRAHRIGQKNKVMIYRFVSRHTVEEKMTQVCKKKMMLTELVIQKNMGAEKTDSLSKQEVNDILRFGAEELFKDDDETKELVYDDEAVQKLLDRSQVNEVVEDQEKEFGLNEYLRSFKVASYQVKEGAGDEVPEEEEEDEDLRKPEEDREYWKRVLGDAYEEHRLQMLQEQENLAASLGKGKRARRQINYAERVLMETPEISKKEKRVIRAAPEDEEDEEEEDREDLKFFSDYEPETSDSDYSGEEEGGMKSKEATPPPQEPVVKKRGRMKFADKIEKEREEKMASKELPPLLSKVNGEIEVLGFTARQRRAFHDAIMRYGMPHEDVYRSQWLVRDLRTVPEKAFKAYVSLFMRHLGEPIKDSNSDLYSDGVPREGLSRQHVLARIGMMALIRKKVAEFEKHNGCHSMKIKSIFKIVKENVDARMKKLTEKEEKKDKEDVKEEKDSKKNGKEESEKKEGEEADDKEKEKDEKKESKSKDEKKESKSDSEKETKEEKDGEGKEEKDVKDKDEKKDDSITNGASEEKKEKDGSEEKKESEEKSEEKKESEVKSEENTEEKKKTDDEEKVKDDSKEKGDSKDGKEDSKSEKEEKEEKMEVDEGKENKEKKKDAKSEDSKGKEVSKSESKEKKEESKKDEKKTKEEKQIEILKRQVEERQEKARQLRKVFYIADGGLTDLKNLWNYEEGMLKEENEMLIWHRQHDYWLLTGTITHGYRHWQDILNDPRFELLNKAFNNDADKMRKGAFLNRRFQLLEQALTIEEQLRRELNDNDKLQQLLPPVKDPKSVDNYTDIDRLADLLRSLIKDGRIPAGTDERLIKLLVQIENLVGDIRQASYSGMPATLARAPIPQPRSATPNQRANFTISGNQRNTPVRQMLEQRKQDPSSGKKGNVILID